MALEKFFDQNNGGEQPTRERKPLTVSYNANWKSYWDIFIILVAIYSGFFIPFVLAFDHMEPILGDQDWYIALDAISSLIYLGDILLSFRTTYLDNFGDEITDINRIAKHYLTSSTFWIDTLSLLSNPFTSMLPARYNLVKTICSFLGMFKIVRFTRFRQFIRSATFDKNLKAMLNFFYFICLLVIYVHIVSCLWYLVVHTTYCEMNPHIPDTECKDNLKPGEYKLCPPGGCITRKWIPPYDFYDYTQSNFFYDKEQSSKFRRYWVCMYYMVLVIGGNELGP